VPSLLPKPIKDKRQAAGAGKKIQLRTGKDNCRQSRKPKEENVRP